MAKILGVHVGADKIGTMSQSAGVITMAASIGVPAILTIGGTQYTVTSNLTRTIATDVTLTLQNLYMVYAVVSAGVATLRVSTNLNSVGPAGFTSWKLVGAFYTDASAAFIDFVSAKSITPSTTQKITSTSPTTYNVPPKAVLRVRMCGGGGGGSGSGTIAGTAAVIGSNTTFGSLLTATGGGQGIWGSSAGVGGGFVINAGAVGIGLEGTYGGTHTYNAMAVGNFYPIGANGGGCPMFSPGQSGNGGQPANLQTTNYGAGGAGGGTGTGAAGMLTGASGGGGGSLDVIIALPASSYTVQCGIGGTAGGAGTAGAIGGLGQQGVIFIEEIKPNLEQLLIL
jgi:hypothetical protein